MEYTLVNVHSLDPLLAQHGSVRYMSTLTHEGDDDEVVFLPVTKHFLDTTILTSLSQQLLDFEEGPASY